MQRTYTAETEFTLTNSDTPAGKAKAHKFNVQVLFTVTSDVDDDELRGRQIASVTHKPEITGFMVELYGKWHEPGDVLHDLILYALVEDDEWLMDAAREQALDEDPAADERRRREGEAGRAAAMQAQEARRG